MSAQPEDVKKLKLDLGCGKNKHPGFLGVDEIAFDGVDTVVDLRKPWPWENESVDEVYSSHFLEHLYQMERVHFYNELYRVMKWDTAATIVTPHWSNACAYGDPTHKWPPLSEWAYLYTNKAWRDVNAPHLNKMMSCDFEHVIAGSWEVWLNTRNQAMKEFSMSRYINSYRDLIVTLTKVKRG